ncbi:hypothetical protein ACTFIR_011158 [Dictyostelium discoideum]
MDNNNNSSVIICTNKNCNNDKLFFKFFRNKYIKTIIISHLRIYANLYKYTRYKTFNNLNEDILNETKFRSYITFLRIDNGNSYIKSPLLLNNNSNGGVCSSSFEQENGNNKNYNKLAPFLETLIFGNYFNEEIPLNYLPKSLTSLIFGNSFNHYLSKELLEPLVNLKSLTIGSGYKHKIDYIPPCVKFLKITSNHKEIKPPKKHLKSPKPHPIIHISDDEDEDEDEEDDSGSSSDSDSDSDSSDGIEEINEIDEEYDEDEEDYNEGYDDLELEHELNDSEDDNNIRNNYSNKINIIEVDILPKSLISLSLSNFKLVKGCIPESVKILNFVEGFDQMIEEGVLPLNGNLKELNLGSTFNKPLQANSLPLGLEKLIIGDSFHHEISNNILPNSLKTLVIGRRQNNNSDNKNLDFLGNLNKLEKLIIFNPFVTYKIPSSVTSLCYNSNNKLNNISNIKELYLLDDFNLKLSNLLIPSSVTSITFGKSFDQIIEIGEIPISVTNIQFGSIYNKPLKNGSLPNSLKKITFGLYWNQQLKPNDIPNSCEEIIFGDFYDKPLTNDLLPTNLKSITFGKYFNKSIPLNLFSNTLQLSHISFSDHFNKKIQPNTLPNTILNLKFGKLYNHSFNNNTNNNNDDDDIEYSIPLNLKRIKFGKHFEKYSTFKIPKSLLCIKFNFGSNYVDKEDSLLNLIKSTNNSNSIYKLCFQNLPKGINLSNFLEFLPSSIRVLKISNGSIGDINNGKLPYFITDLILPQSYSISQLDLNIIKTVRLNWSVSLFTYFQFIDNK